MLALLGLPLRSAAQQLSAAMPRYEIGWADALITGGIVIVGFIPVWKAEQLPHATCAPCDPAKLWGIDRAVVGEYRAGPDRFSDVTLVTTMAGGGALALAAWSAGPSEARWEDLAVYAQALAIDGAVTQWTNVLTRRPRPPRYSAGGADPRYAAPNWGLSFPSGHTSMAFASAAAYASLLERRGRAGEHGAEIALLFGTATATAVLRVAARKHFPTDVIAGAVLGTAIGWIVPRVHATR